MIGEARGRRSSLRYGRHDFDLPEDRVWLDTAHQGPLPRRAAEAAARAVEWKLDPSRLADQAFFDAPDRLRSTLAALLDCPAEEVVLGNSASHGLHVLAGGLDFEEGEEVLLVQDDFPATVLPWLPLRGRGVRIRFLPRRSGLSAEEVAGALRPGTRLLCVTWVDSFSGHVLDLEGVGNACEEAGVLLVLNATQGLGVRPLSVRSISVDAVTSAGYKWLCGPYGTGACWISRDLLSRLRSDRWYWLAAARAQGLQDLTGLAAKPPPSGVALHDVFGTASFFNVLPWTAALEYLLEVGPETLAAHNRALVAALRRVLKDAGYAPLLEEEVGKASPFAVFDAPDEREGRSLASRLRDEGIHVAVREGRLRVSPHIHNDLNDIDRFEQVLRGGSRD